MSLNNTKGAALWLKRGRNPEAPAYFTGLLETSTVTTTSELRPFIHEGQDQHTSCTAHHGEPLLCPYLRTTWNFFAIFLGWAMLLHPQATSMDQSGPRTSDISIERRRRNHFTTTPLWWKLFFRQILITSSKGRNRVKQGIILKTFQLYVIQIPKNFKCREKEKLFCVFLIY